MKKRSLNGIFFKSALCVVMLVMAIPDSKAWGVAIGPVRISHGGGTVWAVDPIASREEAKREAKRKAAEDAAKALRATKIKDMTAKIARIEKNIAVSEKERSTLSSSVTEESARVALMNNRQERNKKFEANALELIKSYNDFQAIYKRLSEYLSTNRNANTKTWIDSIKEFCKTGMSKDDSIMILELISDLEKIVINQDKSKDLFINFTKAALATQDINLVEPMLAFISNIIADYEKDLESATQSLSSKKNRVSELTKEIKKLTADSTELKTALKKI